MLAQQMRHQNWYHKEVHPEDTRKPFLEVDIRFAEYQEWLEGQPQCLRDAVMLGMLLAEAYRAKYSSREPSQEDKRVLALVEEAQKRLGVDFLYSQ